MLDVRLHGGVVFLLLAVTSLPPAILQGSNGMTLGKQLNGLQRLPFLLLSRGTV